MSATATIRTILQIKFTFAPSSTVDFLAATRPVYALVTKLREFESISVLQNPKAPGEFMLLEHWNASPEFILKKVQEENVLRNFIATTEKISIKPKEVDFWCPVSIEDESDTQKL
ncbi:hypothetical protein HBI56_177460 [Parastagonospora nodorum]|nr:hypothetical protein HBH53_244000 [Parastagonospora nodorum]KAH3957341.1 hypothetical protein HBH51_226960 [Parastagonospora nodorum]KAH3973153.1 hypothetical protein HBH52_147640 [Parastagonospora nodorum]KAH4004100.1 hypothetical protein HBI10_054580 [Parastagonospora nodorum]KAH4017093.1 hypothetical protein HBI13_147410 [Parastagonospora nodorum]